MEGARTDVAAPKGTADLTLETVQHATNTAAARAVAETALEATGWQVAGLRRDAVRLEPPTAYWASYRVRVQRETRNGPEERRLVLVARACFQRSDWERYAEWLTELYGEGPCRPIEGLGYPVLVDATQDAWWFYPVDPQLQTLAAASDPRQVRRLLAPRYSAKTPPARIKVEQVRYLPEISAALRYRVVDRPGAPERVVYGKLYRGDRGRELHETTRRLWELSQQQPDLLSVVEPLAYDADLALHLEHAAAGTAVGSDRTDPVFLDAAIAAAEALAVLHGSDVPSHDELLIEPELSRLDEVTHQMSLVHPDAGRLLRDLAVQLRSRLSRSPAEEVVFTHGDMKYDQFLVADGHFTLVDFEEVGRGETSWDLGKWCAHSVPSMPESWEDSDGAERARAAFLRRYLELRPDATRARFPIYEATHLANRAMVLMWGQLDNWQVAAQSLLTLAMERLQTPAP
jgi:aminoglycoside phosphotransferase